LTIQTAVTPQLSGYEMVHKSFDQLIHSADHEALDLAMACVLANGRDGDALAMFLVAPASTGKTEIINAMRDTAWTYELTSLTPQTLASGFSGGDGSPDASLLNRLKSQKKFCLLNKEFATILTMRQTDRDAILGQLREVLDGSVNKTFGTGKEVGWKGKLGILAGVTPQIDKTWSVQTSLGDRWMWVRVNSPEGTEERVETALAAIDADQASDDLRTSLRKQVNVLLSVRRNTDEPIIDQDQKIYIAELADLVARGRTPIDHDNNGNVIQNKPSPEGAPRLAKAFHRLALSVATVRGNTSVSAADLRTLRRVAIDTVPPSRSAVYQALCRRAETASDVAASTSLGRSLVNRTLQELEMLRLVDRQPQKTGEPGRPADIWTVI
jgi:hypothetical protein